MLASPTSGEQQNGQKWNVFNEQNQYENSHFKCLAALNLQFKRGEEMLRTMHFM